LIDTFEREQASEWVIFGAEALGPELGQLVESMTGGVVVFELYIGREVVWRMMADGGLELRTLRMA
jgi:hypothetical protein